MFGRPNGLVGVAAVSIAMAACVGSDDSGASDDGRPDDTVVGSTSAFDTPAAAAGVLAVVAGTDVDDGVIDIDCPSATAVDVVDLPGVTAVEVWTQPLGEGRLLGCDGIRGDDPATRAVVFVEGLDPEGLMSELERAFSGDATELVVHGNLEGGSITSSCLTAPRQSVAWCQVMWFDGALLVSVSDFVVDTSTHDVDAAVAVLERDVGALVADLAAA